MSSNDNRANCRGVLLFLTPATVLTVLALAAAGRAGEETAKPAGSRDAGPSAIVVQEFSRAPEEKTPWGSLRWLMTEKIDPQSNMTLGIAELNPGKSNPVHVHDNCDEVIYILSGSCEQRIGERTVIMKAGDTVHIPAGVPHTARALGNEPMRSVVAYNSGDRHFKAQEDKPRALEPANPKTNAKARAILDYLGKLPQRADKRLLSGQFTDAGPTAKLAMCEETQQKTGRWPAMIGLDYADFAKGGLEYKTVNRVAIEYTRQGGLVTISAHLYNPANPKGGGLRDQGVDLKKILTPGNEAHDRWMKELDTMAAGLKELQDAEVVVLWRPFHEMNGDWFWWGGKDPETFIRVWRHMFDYFTKTKGLDNLLWVYSPNHGSKTADYYAGDRYVDIVGLDAYTDFVDPQHIRGYDAVAKLPKPFGFTEFGPHGPHNPPGNYDYRRFIDGIQKHFPKTTFFLAWHNKWSLGRNQNAKQLLENPWLVNREDLPESFSLPKK